MAYGGRLGFWYRRVGINFGVSEFVNAPYSKQSSGAVMSIWQPYFNYHRGNWDFRFEYGHNYERTKPFIGNNINRDRLLHPDRLPRLPVRSTSTCRRLEYVFRFSEAHVPRDRPGER